MKLIELLCEAKTDFLANKYKSQLERQIGDMSFDSMLDVVNELLKADPTNGKYLEWIVRQFCDGHFLLEDIDTVREDLIKFESFKSRLQNKKDINSYRNIFELREKIAELEGNVKDVMGDAETGEQFQSLIDTKDITLIYNNGRIRIFRINTFAGSSLVSKGTRWCTQRKEHFENYSDQGPLYVVYIGVDKYQLHFESMQFMTVMDRQISHGEISDKDVEVLRHVFIKKLQIISRRMPIWMLAASDILERWKLIKGKSIPYMTEKDQEIILIMLTSKNKLITDVLKNDHRKFEYLFLDLTWPNPDMHSLSITKHNIDLLVYWYSSKKVDYFLTAGNADIFNGFIERLLEHSTYYCGEILLKSVFRNTILLKNIKEEPTGKLSLNMLQLIKTQEYSKCNRICGFLKGKNFYKIIPSIWVEQIPGFREQLEKEKMSYRKQTANIANYLLSLNQPKVTLKPKEKRLNAANDPSLIRYAQRSDLTEKYIFDAITLKPSNIKFVPDDMITDDMLFLYLRKVKSIGKLMDLPESKVPKSFTDQLIAMGYTAVKKMFYDRYHTPFNF